jgi:hypothetical protein
MVFENRMLRRIFGPRRDEVMGGWRKRRNGALQNWFSTPNRMIKPGRMRWAGHVAFMGEIGMRIKFWLESLKGRDYSEDLYVSGRIILKWILGKLDLGV